jgi:hypothetical protein
MTIFIEEIKYLNKISHVVRLVRNPIYDIY